MISKLEIKIPFLLFLTLCSCYQPENKDTSEFKEEMESRKLQRVTEGQLITFASKLGKMVLDSNEVYSKSIVVSNLDTIYNTKIQKLRLPDLTITGKLKELTEAYCYNIENKIESEDNLQKENDSILLYTRPIIENNSLTGIYVINFNKKNLIKKYTNKL